MKMNSKNSNVIPLKTPEPTDILSEICRDGARKMLQQALEREIAEYLERHQHLVDEEGMRLVVRNGHMKERSIQTGIGAISVKQPRINDRRIDENGNRLRYHSSILPPYLRRTKSMEELIPWLYLRGISSGDFTDALASILGPDAPGLSATTVTRLKSVWMEEYQEWKKRSLKGKRYIYIWVDGIYSRVRLGGEGEKQCLLVVMGATSSGDKELIAVEAGQRESEISWRDVLLDLKKRGLNIAPELATGDGALGFWVALEKVFPTTKRQRCWVHKTVNVLDKLPKSQHGRAKAIIHDIWMASKRKEAEASLKHFEEVFGDKYPKATACLIKDKEDLLAFYDFPAKHWKHIRTTNPIESTFATIRLRTRRTKGHGSPDAALSMMFKLAKCAEKQWRKLDGAEALAEVIDIKVKFVDGERVAA